MYTEKDLDDLIEESINECQLIYVQHFRKTQSGFDAIKERVKQHILVRGIEDVDTALGLVDNELQEPYIETK